MLLHFTFIGDSKNVSLMTMRVYLTVLFTVDWIMICLLVHLPTFQPPVDGARSLASSPVKGFYRKIKSLVWYLLGSFDRSAVSLRNLKIILNYT